MHEALAIELATIFALAISAQWIGWRYHIPSLILLLVFGFVAGPAALGLIDPDHLLGELLIPLVSIAVGLILFEGGLSLRFSEIAGLRGSILSLISLGMIVTWVIGAWSAHYLLHLDMPLAILLGAVLTVSGPTVVIPLLRDIRPKANLSSILKWEGILIDPIGALVAVLVFDAIVHGGSISSAPALIISGVAVTALIGSVIGVVGALLLIFLIRRYLIPDYLLNPLTLSLVIVVFVVSNFFQPESGLFAVTLMGIILANVKNLTIHHIIEFKENLQVLLIGVLFILLSARIRLEHVEDIGFNGLLFLFCLMFIARPLAVFISTFGSELTTKEKLFLSWMAPRGIVAAAVASLFALELSKHGFADAEKIVSFTFLVIVGAGFIYGFTARPVGRFLGVRQLDPQGVLFLGAHSVSRELAVRLKDEGFKVLLVDTNWANVSAAKLKGLPSFYGNILSEHVFEQLDLDGVGKLFALTPNDEANSLACLRIAEDFGRAQVFQLPPDNTRVKNSPDLHPKHLRGRFLFGEGEHYSLLQDQLASGATIKTISVNEEFSYEDVKSNYPSLFIPVILIQPNSSKFIVLARDVDRVPQPGEKIIALVKA